MWLTAWKRVENWILWIVGDIFCIPLFVFKEYYLSVAQFSIFIIIAFMGYFEWKKGIKESRNIVITGPESSGKTTLFEQLKTLSGFSFIQEKSRTYLEKIDRPYHYNDILLIAKQYVKELELLSQNKLSVISDTDLLTLQIWCEYKYKKVSSIHNRKY